MAQYIIDSAHFQLVDLLSHESQELIHTIDYDTTFDVVLVDFWEPSYIPDEYGY